MNDPNRSRLPYLSAAILLCPSFTATPMACFSDALRLAADYHDNSQPIFFRWSFASATGGETASSSGLPVSPTIGLEQILEFDCIVVCGGLLRDFDRIRPEVYTLLREAHADDRIIVGLCTGSFVLAEAGLLDGGESAIQANVLRDFVERYPGITPLTQKNYSVDRNVITCPGGILSIDVAAHIIRNWGSAGKTFKALDYLLFNYEDPRSKFPMRPYQERLDRASDLVRDAVRLMEAHMDRPFTVLDLADRLATTRTRLTRKFTRDMGQTPGAFWRDMRLDIACRLLLERRQTVTRIGYDVGFLDAAHFCRSFKARFKVTPQAFRRKLQTA